MKTKLGLYLLLLLLAGCGEPEPLRLGFLGGVTGAYAELGIPGRNGAMLAVELKNQQGGVAGRKIELLVRDDKQDPEWAKQAVDDLLAQNVKAIIGPMTSRIASAVVPKMNAAHVLMMGVTVTTVSLAGRDDYFYRVSGTTADFASNSARYHHETLGLRKAALVMDVSNRDYTDSWSSDYVKTFESLGGKVVSRVEFDSLDDSKNYQEISDALLKEKPDVISLGCRPVDAAVLAQTVRRSNESVRLYGLGWVGTRRLIELGGYAIEGMQVEQYFDPFDASPRYRTFYQAFVERFGQEPGFAGTRGYDAALAIIAALEKDPSARNLKKTLAEMERIQGVQGEIAFDAFGDAARISYFSEVRNGQFVPAR